MDNKQIGQKIKKLRKAGGLSQSELAEKLGISFQQVQKYEKGITQISVMRLQQVAEALETPIVSFFEPLQGSTQIADMGANYSPAQVPGKALLPLNSEEILIVKLFRQTGNKKIREGLLKQLKGIIEVENPLRR